MLQNYSSKFFYPAVRSLFKGREAGFQSTCSPMNADRVPILHGGFHTSNTYSNEERQLLQKWLEMCKFEGKAVPQNITEPQFENLLKVKTISQRNKYLLYLCKKEWGGEKKLGQKKKLKEALQSHSQERFEVNTAGHIHYGLWNNSMMGKIADQNVTDLHHHKLVSATFHSRSLIFDLGFEKNMTPREIGALSQDVVSALFMNRKRSSPFNITLCNADPDSEIMQTISQRLPKIFPIQITSKSYLELYPKKDLVYLSPDSRSEMSSFLSPNDVYIIGGIVEMSRKDPLTLAKAKREKIRVRKFPLDRYVLFRRNKSLDIPLVTSILFDLQETSDWRKAFQSIPKYYLFESEREANPPPWKVPPRSSKRRKTWS